MQIYIWINLKDNKKYVGKTKNNFLIRNREHLGIYNAFLRNPTKMRKLYAGSRFYLALFKHGIENFICILLHDNIISERLLGKLEECYMRKFQTCNKKFGYNVNSVSFGGDNMTNNPNLKNIRKKIRKSVKKSNPDRSYMIDVEKRKIWIEKISSSCKKRQDLLSKIEKSNIAKKGLITKLKNGNHPSNQKMKKINSDGVKKFWSENPAIKKRMIKKVKNKLKGKKFSEEHCKNISKSKKGIKVSQQTKNKISKFFKGRKLSDEHKKKISQSNKGKIFSLEHCRNISLAKKSQKYEISA